MKKRVIAVFLVVAMGVAMLAGCGTKAPDSQGGSGDQGTTEDGGSTGQEEGSSGGEKRVLTFNTNSWAAPQNVPGLQELFDQWEEENNAKLEITVGTDDYLGKLLQDINAGNVSDIVMVDGSNLAEIDKTGALVPLDKWYTPEKRAEHYPYAAEGCVVDGEAKSVWFHGGLWNLYYRKDLLEEAGYKEPPKDWDELLEVAKALTVDEDGDGVIDCYGLGIPAFPDAVTACTLLPWFWGHGDGAELTDGAEKVTFGEGKGFDAMLDTMEFIQTLINEGVVSPDIASVNFNDVQANFVGGQTAMAILGNWHYPLMQESGGQEFIEKIGIAEIPAVPGQDYYNTAGGWNLAMFTQDPQQQELAWNFMEFYRSIEVQTLFTRMGQMSSLLAVYEQDEFKNDPVWQVYSQGLYGAKVRDGVVFYSAVDEAFRQMIQSAATGETDLAGIIQEEAEKAQKIADDLLKQ